MNHYHTRFCRGLLPVCVALLAGLLLACNTLAQDSGARRGGRIAPPSVISCDHDQLTSWTGAVSGYRREENSTWIEISTDEQTVEQTAVPNDGSADAYAHYLLWGEPFKKSDWPAIETSPGKLISGMRATAWVCLDGKTPPVIDWQPKRD